MSNDQGGYPKLGATFTPGGVDDFYMPEVISPAPQRITPEVPENIQNNLAHLELEANPPKSSAAELAGPSRMDSVSSVSDYRPTQYSSRETQALQQERQHQQQQQQYQHQQQQLQQQQQQQQQQQRSQPPPQPLPQAQPHPQPQYQSQPQYPSQPQHPPQPQYQSQSQPQHPPQPQYQSQPQPPPPQTLQNPPATASQGYDNGTADGAAYRSFSDGAQERRPVYTDYRQVAPPRSNAADQPSFSPFPRLQNPSANVPPSDDEKEATLEQARLPVLNSNDPEMQLAWAQDALAYVEVALSNEARLSEQQPPRPQTPQVEHQLRVDAISIVSFLADQHHPRAEFMKGMWLEFGKFGFRVDKKEAFRCYSRSAEKGYARAEYRMGMQYESSNEHAKAIKHYSQGVALGDSASNYRLGMMTLLGQHGQKQDYARGVHLIRYAAHHADENAPQGAYVYGMLQARELEKMDIPELFLPVDINSARINIEKAAYLGFAKAQLKMGTAFELSQLGCDFNPALALHYDALASRQGEPEADMAISKWFLCGFDGVFEKNEELAFMYALRAAQSGLPTAEFAMGYFHEIGMYTPVDLKEARRWYEIAADHGNKDAAGRIDGLSRSKTLSKKDHENVAIAKIKSQYGSQKGKKPDRFKPAPPPMPTINDERIDFPDPSSPQHTADPNSSYLNAFGGNAPPARPASAAPYPLEDGPLASGGLTPSKSAGMINPMQRPSSAFGIHPDLRPVSMVSIPAGPPPGPAGHPGAAGYYRQASVPPPAVRPLSSLDNFAPGRGRGVQGRPPGQRVQSLGLAAPPHGGPPPPQWNGQPGGPALHPQHPQHQQVSPQYSPQHSPQHPPQPHKSPQPPQPEPPRLEIGFSAPPDPDLEKRHRLHKAQAANPHLAHQVKNSRQQSPSGQANAPRPATANPAQSQSSQPPHPDQGRPAKQSSKPPPTEGRSGTFGGKASQQPPPRTDSRPEKGSGPPGKAPSKAPGAGHGPPKPTGGPPPAQGGPPKPSKSAAPSKAAAPARPPGKGPKTFEEMGVPKADKEGDCLVM